ncbi:hypothetical protein H2199_000235 [Coniosporium tulheliwenetii]|uniref:Uncharacterized protein n=1 Tax=Coniosporium tulheliwenetii TaxID=3383036 RepID=A0ACC2ZPM9_9PEZI|nr:hypothetical protein H2199_000235 [Cladosporium sp. JES 115]
MTAITNDEESLTGLQELEPSPVEDSPTETKESYFPSASTPSPPPEPLRRSTTLGLSGHTPVYWLSRIHRYSTYPLTLYAAFHVTNTAIIPLATKSIAASDTYLLLTRPYYQSFPLEPLLIVLPLAAHIGSGLALRIYRRRQNLQRYGAESRKDRRNVPWPPISGTSKLGYLLMPLITGHAFINRVIPLYHAGGSSGIGLEYVSHGFAKFPAVSFAGFGALVAAGVLHITWGWAKWLGWTPNQVTEHGEHGQMLKKRRWYGINAASAFVTAVWIAGGLGVVGRAGPAGGWVGREYDELFQHIPILGRWM